MSAHHQLTLTNGKMDEMEGMGHGNWIRSVGFLGDERRQFDDNGQLIGARLRPKQKPKK